MSYDKKQIDEAYSLYEASCTAAKRGDIAGALAKIERAIALYPRPVYFTIKARFLRRGGRTDEALVEAQRSVDLDQENSHGWTMLGLLYEDREDYVTAGKCFSRSAEIEPNYSVYTLLASVQLKYDTQAAVLSARRALELNPDWEEAQNILEAAESAEEGP